MVAASSDCLSNRNLKSHFSNRKFQINQIVQLRKPMEFIIYYIPSPAISILIRQDSSGWLNLAKVDLSSHYFHVLSFVRSSCHDTTGMAICDFSFVYIHAASNTIPSGVKEMDLLCSFVEKYLLCSTSSLGCCKHLLKTFLLNLSFPLVCKSVVINVFTVVYYLLIYFIFCLFFTSTLLKCGLKCSLKTVPNSKTYKSVTALKAN